MITLETPIAMAENRDATDITEISGQNLSQSKSDIQSVNPVSNGDGDSTIQICVKDNKPRLFCPLKPQLHHEHKKHRSLSALKKPIETRKKEAVDSFIKQTKQSRDDKFMEARSIDKNNCSPTSDFEKDLNVKLSMIMKKYIDNEETGPKRKQRKLNGKSKSAPSCNNAKSNTKRSSKRKIKSLDICLLKDRPKVQKRILKDTKCARENAEQSSGCCVFDMLRDKLGLKCQLGDPDVNEKTESKKSSPLKANKTSEMNKNKANLRSKSKKKKKKKKKKKRHCKHTNKNMEMKIDNKHNKKGLVVTLDTNILISQLDFVRRLLGRQLPGYGAPRVMLPWAVLQELDHIKDSRKRGRNYRPDTVAAAARAIRLIHQRLPDKEARLVGQTPSQAYNVEAAGGISVLNNDDRILASVIQERKKSPKDTVVLLTEDINLANKSHVAGITAANTRTFLQKLNLKEIGFQI